MQVCSLSQRSYIAHPLFVGFVDSCEADIGMTVLDDDGLDDQNFDTMFSMGFLKRITNQTMLQFYAVPQLTPHVEKVDKEWVDINVASPNSYHLHCSLYSSLNACPPDKICLLHVTDWIFWLKQLVWHCITGHRNFCMSVCKFMERYCCCSVLSGTLKNMLLCSVKSWKFLWCPVDHIFEWGPPVQGLWTKKGFCSETVKEWF